MYFCCFDGSKIVVRVTGFNDGIVYGDSKKGSHWCNIENVEPIPLTPEILERMGFEVEEDPIYEYDEDEDDIEHTYTAKMKCVDVRKCNTEIKYRTTYRNEIFVFSSDHYNTLPSRRIDTQIEYVHELQHIMRLFGIEKEIVL